MRRLDESRFTETDLDLYFPPSYQDSRFVDLCALAFSTFSDLMPQGDLPRVPGWQGAAGYQSLLDHYGALPATPSTDPMGLVRSMASDLLAGAINWRCPDLQYNLGAAVNVVAAAMYALALDVNVYLINDGLAGNAVVAENAVGRILAELAEVDPRAAHGVFVFGGTGTMAYAIKAGIRKAVPDSAQRGLPGRVKLLITEDAHFSHATAADWLGIGNDDLLVISPGPDRRSRLDDAERLLRTAFDAGCLVPTILLNGGTTYDHAVDDVLAFVELRDRLAGEYSLCYMPHLHVDSVVGWAWLMFTGYDFHANPLGIHRDALELIAQQYERIRKLRFADSWGIDFHKGVGACPIDCSIIMFNNRADLARMAKGGSSTAGMHQLAEEFSAESPVEYTLETSRAGGKALAALASLHSLGRAGYQTLLGRLIENTVEFRKGIDGSPDIDVLNPYALGYQTMVRLHPSTFVDDRQRGQELVDAGPEMADFIQQGNQYLKAFFSWDNGTRMDVNGGGVVYSFSRKYVRSPSGVDISGLKFYPTSPRITIKHVTAAVELLQARKAEFDRHHASG